MTVLLQAKGLGYSLGSKQLFKDLNLAVNSGDRIGLVGHNGAGKSSLLGLLAGRPPDDGEVISSRGLRVSVVEQFVPEALRDVPLREAVLRALPADERMAYKAETLLVQLGFGEAQFDVPVARLSGGEQNLSLLARAQIRDPELLLMDEPGNHMDVSALAGLRAYLRAANLTYVMVSHDRDLLDDCCNRTVFLRDLRTYAFDLPYSDAKAQLEQADEQAAHRAETEGKEIDRIRRSAKRLAQWGKTYDNEDLSRKAKSMERRAEKLEQSKTFVTAGSGLSLSLESSGMRSKTALSLENLRVCIPGTTRELVRCEFLVARPGDRIALLGHNGAGKSTTIKQLLQPGPRAEVRFNPNVKIGYFDQELDEFVEPASRYEWLARRTDAKDDEIKRTLLQAGIAYRDFPQPVASLSGGEKARLVFMLQRLNQPNFLILDEPTNHIDLESREQLEQELAASGATLLITSHDRHFLSGLCTRFWLISDGQLREIDDLDVYYAQMPGWGSIDTIDPKPETPDDLPANEEDALRRIEELEALLAADVTRKAKFQKPERQAHWRREIERLWQWVQSD